MPLPPITNSPRINHITKDNAATLDPLSKWVNDAPHKEANDRHAIAHLVRKAQLDGALHIPSSTITSLPPIPEGISTLSISDCHALGSLPALPNSLKSLDVKNCQNLAISCFPPGLEQISVKLCLPYLPYKLPELPNGLLHLSSDLHPVPALPTGLLSLSLSDCDDLKRIPALPAGLEKLEVKDSTLLSRLPALPDKLKKLNLTKVDLITQLPTPLPNSLNVLEIDNCRSIKFPTELPRDLSQLTLFEHVDPHNNNKKKCWSILPQNLPPRVHLILSENIKFDQELLKLPGVTFGAMFSDLVQNFRSGDILYGLRPRTHALSITIAATHNFSDKDIVKQRTLTNSVFHASRTNFKTDREINARLNDVDRGLEFKKFLTGHDRYNVMKEEFVELPTRQRWAKTSKAGLEFQTKVREKSVFFCVDALVDSIPDIASKRGPHGDAITAHELRWLYRHRDDEKVKENVQFYLRGSPVSHESVFLLKGWDTYQPKNEVKQPVD